MLKTEKSIAFHTIGCKLNFSETSYLSNLFSEKGFRVVPFGKDADFYVVHTCAVTEVAEKKCRTLIRSIKKRAPHSKTAVIGCYSELRKAELEAMPEVDFVLGTFDKYSLPDLLADSSEHPQTQHDDCVIAGMTRNPPTQTTAFIPTFSSGDRTRTFLKVQDGCDYFCTYCTIPHARGRSRSNTIAETLDIAHQAIDSGAKEIVLTGVNVGDFGKHHGETFFALLQALDAIRWDGRIRLSSIEPELLGDEIIRFVASSQHIMPHFHIPLQSGSDKILKLMRRRYSRDLFAQRIETIRQFLPFACIAVDVIVGFPEETEADFLDTQHFLEALNISALHVFPFSARPGTSAATMEQQIPLSQRKERSKILCRLSEEKKIQFIRSNIGRTENVLFESEHSKGNMYGFTRNYIKVATSFDKDLINKEIIMILNDLNHDNEFIYKQ
jgi:threonylcarbamoyladenosine tRNA methylthiotransferase MtaB